MERWNGMKLVTRPAKCSYFYAFYISEIKVFLTYDCRLHSTAKKRIRINFSIRKYRDKEVNEFRVAFTPREKFFLEIAKIFLGKRQKLLIKDLLFFIEFLKNCAIVFSYKTI